MGRVDGLGWIWSWKRELDAGAGGAGRWAVLWRPTLSISERERLSGIGSKLVLSRRRVRRLDVAGGSQLGEQQQQ